MRGWLAFGSLGMFRLLSSQGRLFGCSLMSARAQRGSPYRLQSYQSRIISSTFLILKDSSSSLSKHGQRHGRSSPAALNLLTGPASPPLDGMARDRLSSAALRLIRLLGA